MKDELEEFLSSFILPPSAFILPFSAFRIPHSAFGIQKERGQGGWSLVAGRWSL